MNAVLTNIRNNLIIAAVLVLMNGITSGAASQQDAAALPFICSN